MKFILSFFLILLDLPGFGQSLSGLNFNYWYDPNSELEFVIVPVKPGSQMMVYYQLVSNRKENSVDTYSIAWESRENLSERNGEVFNARDSVILKSANSISGVLSFPTSSKIGYLLAKITNLATQEVFYFYKTIDMLWPVNNVITVDGVFRLKGYLSSGTDFSFGINSGKKIYGFLYKKKFSAALPPFAEGGGGDPFLKADSVFEWNRNSIPQPTGLYLFQEDTLSAQGVSFLLMEKNYPRYTRVATLAAPLIYITTDEEFKQLAEAQSDKTAFDKVILGITRDKERAKNLMRSYFQRVEMANRYFTEYKEGWKTDRGMIYIIYGKPDEVNRTADSEVWFYKNQKTRFVFYKSGSVFCPENYKLQRDKQYTQEWFSLVDLWRKSRF